MVSASPNLKQRWFLLEATARLEGLDTLLTVHCFAIVVTLSEFHDQDSVYS